MTAVDDRLDLPVGAVVGEVGEGPARVRVDPFVALLQEGQQRWDALANHLHRWGWVLLLQRMEMVQVTLWRNRRRRLWSGRGG